MYLFLVVLCMAVLPIGSIVAELLIGHGPAPIAFLIGKWFVFWSVGVRLLAVGGRQILQPASSARVLFGVDDPAASLPTQELGFAGAAMGFVGCATLLRPAWILPAAVFGGLFYAFAGARRATEPSRGANGTVTLVSDLLTALILIGFAVFALLFADV